MGTACNCRDASLLRAQIRSLRCGCSRPRHRNPIFPHLTPFPLIRFPRFSAGGAANHGLGKPPASPGPAIATLISSLGVAHWWEGVAFRMAAHAIPGQGPAGRVHPPEDPPAPPAQQERTGCPDLSKPGGDAAAMDGLGHVIAQETRRATRRHSALTKQLQADQGTPSNPKQTPRQPGTPQTFPDGVQHPRRGVAHMEHGGNNTTDVRDPGPWVVFRHRPRPPLFLLCSPRAPAEPLLAWYGCGNHLILVSST